MSKRKLARSEGGTGPRFRPDMKVAEAVDLDVRVKDILHEYGLRCEECIVAWHETLAEGCAPLGLSVAEIVGRLNALDVKMPGTDSGS